MIFIIGSTTGGVLESSDVKVVYSDYNYYQVDSNYDLDGSFLFSSYGCVDFYKGWVYYPSFVTDSSTLATGQFDELVIDRGDFTDSDPLYLHIAEVSAPISEDTDILYYYNEKVIDLRSYYKSDNAFMIVPYSKLGFNFVNDKRYIVYLSSGLSATGSSYGEICVDYVSTYAVYYFTVSGLSSEDILNNSINSQTDAINNQTEVIKEQNETSKNIFQKIGDILSYINPFSENFFAYKLVELIIDGLKSLFIPSDGFFGTFFDNLYNWFSERLGFLFYPFEFIINILNKIVNINFSEPIFKIPDISEPFTGNKLISSTTFNLNDILDTDVFNTMHNIYYVCVDAFIVFGLVNLAKRKFEEVTSK